MIVLTGAGNKSFCAGVDLKERAGRPQTWSASFGTGRAQYWAETVDVMRRHPAVFIAAVNGFALGGGLTLVNTAELAVAARSARFGMPELGFASFPALAGPTSVHRILPKHVSELAFLPGNIDADRAMAIGLVNEVVDDDRADGPRARDGRSGRPVRPHRAGSHQAGPACVERLSWVDSIENGAVTAAVIKAEQRAAKPGPVGENGMSTPGSSRMTALTAELVDFTCGPPVAGDDALAEAATAAIVDSIGVVLAGAGSEVSDALHRYVDAVARGSRAANRGAGPASGWSRPGPTALVTAPRARS